MMSCVPLYHMVRQEYIPTNVDESEFEMSRLSAGRREPRSACKRFSIALYAELKTLPGVQHVCALSRGPAICNAVNNSRVYVRLDDIEDRVFSISAPGEEDAARQAAGSFPRTSTRSAMSCRPSAIA